MLCTEKIMESYLNLLKKVLNEGQPRADRTGCGTVGVFGEQVKIDLTQMFPLLTTKRVHMRSVVHELLWFIKGETNTKYLKENNVSIWDEWADKDGNLGPVYGAQWRSWRTAEGTVIDQLAQVIENLKKDPFSRRHIVSAWNVGEIDKMALPPCHAFFQFYVSPDGGLSCQLYQRSADLFLGVPFNIASYSLLTHMVAQVCGLKPKMFVHTFGDLHLYQNHLEQAQLQLTRVPRSLPTLKLNRSIKNINDFRFDDIIIDDYDPYPAIKAPIAV